MTTHYTYTDHQRMQITGEASRRYDRNGNLTQDAIGRYTYTPAHMLETVELGSEALYLYQYDGDQQRALKHQGSTKTTTYLRGLGQVLSEFEEEGQQLRWTLDQVYLGSHLLAATRPPAGTTLLTIGKAGAGTGTVTSTPSGIDCGPACGGTTGAFPGGTVVWLTATPATGWVFVGWSGDVDCADGVVTLTDPKTCVATFALTAPLFAKQSPRTGGTSGRRTVTLQWAAAPNASYEVCWDTTNNGVCDTAWQWNTTATRRVVEFPEPGTYYWQARTFSASPTEADDGAWRALTMVAAPSFGKQAPATGTTGLGNNVTLTWSAYGRDGYWVCWDTVHNNACDTLWWPASTATTGLENFAPGTYYWQVKTGVTGVVADAGAWWSFTVTTPLVPADHWKAEYFGNQELSGAAAAVVDEGTGFVEHSWGDGGPAGLADHFSARFTRTVTLPAGRYRFTVTTDDGSRLWVNNQLAIDAWWPQPSTGHTAEVDLAGGGHTLRYEYFEQTGGATAQLTWALLTPVVLASGEALWENQTRVSLDGAYRLQYQGDGNLVVVRLADESCAWSSQTNGTTAGMTVMQGDGNLVVYNADWIPVWNSGTAGYDGARLEIANDTMAIVGPDGTMRWSVSLAAEPAVPYAWAGATMGTLLRASRGPTGGGAGVLLCVIALIGLAARALRRRWFGLERASREPQAASRSPTASPTGSRHRPPADGDAARAGNLAGADSDAAGRVLPHGRARFSARGDEAGERPVASCGAARLHAVRRRGRTSDPASGEAAVHREGTGQRDAVGLLRRPVLAGRPRPLHDHRPGLHVDRESRRPATLERLQLRPEQPAAVGRSGWTPAGLRHSEGA